MNPDDVIRLEGKLDKLTEAVGRLVLIEERQAAQNERMQGADKRIEANRLAIENVDRKLDKWINRGVGVWAVAASILALMRVIPLH